MNSDNSKFFISEAGASQTILRLNNKEMKNKNWKELVEERLSQWNLSKVSYHRCGNSNELRRGSPSQCSTCE